jgi:hypothetical protein
MTRCDLHKRKEWVSIRNVAKGKNYQPKYISSTIFVLTYPKQIIGVRQ